MRRPALVIALLALLALALPSAASAQTPAVGIGDQSPDMFSDPNFRALGVKRSRFIVPWNVMSVAAERQRLAAWLTAARAARVEPLISFNHARGDRCPRRPCRAPSVSSYTRAFRAFRRAHPSIRVISPWNEVNSPTQPVAKNARRAAEYYNAVRRYCRGCRIVAADLLDTSSMASYVRTFQRYAQGRPSIWGLHNYGDTNRFRTTGLRRLKSLVRGEIWLTETGGIVSFTQQNNRTTFPYSESRAARATRYLLKTATSSAYRRTVRRIYIYNWFSDRTNRFDAGLVGFDRSPRPAYSVLRDYRRLIR